jgi:serpin B
MKKTSLIILFIAALFLTFSCEFFSNDNDSINVVDVKANALLAPSYGVIDPAIKTAALGANDFAFRLSKELIKSNDSKNFVFSPYSVWLPLAALVNAANVQHRTALLSALGASGITEDSINKAASRMLYDLTNARDEGEKEYYNPLKIVNAIFVDKNVTLRKDFAQTFMDFYRGSSINVDFSSRGAVDAVNNWASKNTNGLITDIIQEFDPLTVAAIANAIYFSDRWSWEFDAKETKKDVFHGPAGESEAFYMLRKGSGQNYYEDDRVQAISLGFKYHAGMYIVLPKTGGAEALLSSMTNEYFTEIQQNSFQAEGKLLLPRFSIENDPMDLAESLEALGVPLFEENSITRLIEEPISLFLSSAIQKAVIEVDEKGTTAAAVTVMAIEATSGPPPPPPKPFEMICDRPFMFILYDYTYDSGNQVLFTGIVNQP